KKWGKLRIQRELKARGLTDYNIEAGLSEITDDDYCDTLNLLAEKKQATIKEKNPYKAKAKLANFLLYRGFEPELVYEIVDELYDE
ncbi:regulatory protein RecX, partial [Capnocytophaga sputigena]